ncbi:alcohol dehydrogenase catalytic domain-containing protein [Streptomyces sp. M600PL45_2]|uniref:Alcohol dehydrogenase catalytic domain-containing protein n=1 Tax=Streptomyces marispadix TaxID=2922868 RepID=A0ABS9SZN4_9ACTN|nr:alcohol dehydrogenase catalytic domain-containing protein [Streptomyces marispadix]MCH6161648.1 alcohol dehydrogenase catalytic domain-containing protein [Streptomyces marispadix]
MPQARNRSGSAKAVPATVLRRREKNACRTAHGLRRSGEARVPTTCQTRDRARARCGCGSAPPRSTTDIWTREGADGSHDSPGSGAGWRREPLAFPRIQGADVAARIDLVGAGVTEARIGDRVLVDPVIYTGGQPQTEWAPH